MSEQRGGGRLAGALASRRRRSEGEDGQRRAEAGERSSARGRREPERVGKSRDPRYKQALGYVRKDVHRTVVDQALRNSEVVSALVRDLDEQGVEHKRGEADYGALVELLLVEWLESVGYAPEK